MIGTNGWLGQTLAVTSINLRSLPQRRGASIAAVVGVAGVVAVMVAVLSIADGFRSTMATTGSAATAIVMRGGTDAEMNSVLTLEDTRIIADGPGVARVDGRPVASAELFVITDVPMRDSGTDANVPLRGIGPAGFDVRQNVRIVDGRRFEPGRDELIVGVGAAQQFAGLDPGSRLNWGEVEMEVVGIFSAAGSVWESELWCDVHLLQQAYRRGNTYQSVYVRLEEAERFDAYKAALTTDPRLDVKVVRESEFFAEQAEQLHGIITTLGFLIAALMAVGAVFGAVNTMYSAVASRTREIATLRALGFSAAPVVISVLVESLLLAALGGVVGGAVAFAAFHGYRASTLNWASFSQVTFEFSIGPSLIATGLAWALLMGLAAGLLPALRAVRLPISTALREL